VLPEGDPGALRLAARVHGAQSGRVLEILTTRPGLQFYSGNNLDGSAPRRGGLYRQSAGFAFEPQGFPNAPNQPGFPSTILQPSETYRQRIIYRLTTAAGERGDDRRRYGRQRRGRPRGGSPCWSRKLQKARFRI
jgi:aldose 1-epimerase